MSNFFKRLFAPKRDLQVRLILNNGNGCQECKNDAAAGWMSVKAIKDLGERQCGDDCTCDLHFEDDPPIPGMDLP